MNLRSAIGMCIVVVSFGAITSAMLGEKMLSSTESESNLLSTESRSGGETLPDIEDESQDVLSNEFAEGSLSLDVDPPGVADNNLSTALARQQFIGPFLDPDSEALDNAQAAVQLIGDPETVDDGFEDTTAPSTMIEEDPDAVVQVSGGAQQFIGQILTVEQFDLLDVEVTQIIGEPESVPAEQ